MKLCSFDHR